MGELLLGFSSIYPASKNTRLVPPIAILHVFFPVGRIVSLYNCNFDHGKSVPYATSLVNMYQKAIVPLASALVTVASLIDKRAVPTDVFNNMDMFMKYASSAYSDACPSPLGNTLVKMASISA